MPDRSRRAYRQHRPPAAGGLPARGRIRSRGRGGRLRRAGAGAIRHGRRRGRLDPDRGRHDDVGRGAPAPAHDPRFVPSSTDPNRLVAVQGITEGLMDNFRKDIRYAIRSLRRQPAFTLIVILTLALGIGANTAVFSVLNAVVLRPLGYPHPEQLELITSQFPSMGFEQFWVSLPEFVEYRDNNHVFTTVGAYRSDEVNLGIDPPARVVEGLVTPRGHGGAGREAARRPLVRGGRHDPQRRAGRDSLVGALAAIVWRQQHDRRPADHGQQRLAPRRRHHAARVRRARPEDRDLAAAHDRPQHVPEQPRQPRLLPGRAAEARRHDRAGALRSRGAAPAVAHACGEQSIPRI